MKNQPNTKRAPKLKVVCQECGKRWSTTNPAPECPKCGGVDVDLADEVGIEAAKALAEASKREVAP